MGSTFRFLVLPGDGIGREVVDAAVRVMLHLANQENIDIALHHDQIGGETYDTFGTFCRDQTVELAKQSDGVLVGAVGGPKWDALFSQKGFTEQDGLMRLREQLNTYFGMRPSRSYTALRDATPFKPEQVDQADVMVLREMCGGSFFREPRGIKLDSNGERRGFDNYLYSESEIKRFARAGFQLARRRKKRVVSMDKSNVMENHILWRDCVSEVAKEFEDVSLDHYYADNGFYQMITKPTLFDVVLSDNLFGDLGSDLAATFAGSLGMLPSACLPGLDIGAGPGIYEPVHGSAPDIAGQGIANPIGTILSVAMMFEYAMDRADLSETIHCAVNACLDQGHRTKDLGGSCTTDQITKLIISELVKAGNERCI